MPTILPPLAPPSSPAPSAALPSSGVLSAGIIPHLAWPPRLARDGTIAIVDQDSPEELAQAAALTLATPVGALIDNPLFGAPDQTFKTQVDAEELQAALRNWEPRLSATVTASAVENRIAEANVTVTENANG